MRRAISRTHLVIATLAIVALAFVLLNWSPVAPGGTQAATTGAKTQMDIVINDGQCDSSVQTKCSLDRGSSFTVQVVPSTIPVGGYAAWQTLVSYGSLLYQPAPGPGSQEITFAPSVMPSRDPALASGKEGLVHHSDLTAFIPNPEGFFPASMQKSTLVTLDFNCEQNAGGNFSETISIIDFDASADGAVFAEPDGSTVHVPNVGSLKINCVAKQPDPGDTDQDGCSDQAENGPNERFGGQRDFLYFWDFYDVWTHPPGDPTGWERNGVVNIFDLLGVALRFGSGPVLNKADALAQALVPPTDTFSYHPAFDRSALIGPNIWDKGPPDGAINFVDDVFGAISQFGHNCA